MLLPTRHRGGARVRARPPGRRPVRPRATGPSPRTRSLPPSRFLDSPAVVLFACLFASQSALLVLSPVLPEVAREFGVSTATVGQLRALSGATGGITALLLALAGRRPGIRALLGAGAGVIAAGSLLSAAAPTFAVLAVAQGALGVGVGLLVAVGIAAAGVWPAPAERPHVLACAIAGMPAAWTVVMPVIGAVDAGGWRAVWIVPAVTSLVALALVLLRPRDPEPRRAASSVAAWRSGPVARFALGELLANAAWASVLTYAGALLLDSYDVSASVVALGLGLALTAMLPGTFSARRHANAATPALLAGLTAMQGGGVFLLAAVRPGVAPTLALLALLAFVNGRRSIVASALGMDSAPGDEVAVMALRAASNQFGYLLGAGAGGLAIALGGFPALGAALAAMFATAFFIHLAPVLPAPGPVPGQATS